MISDMISNARLDLHNLDNEFKELERGFGRTQPGDISFKLDQISSFLREIDIKVANEPKATKDNYKLRVQSLRQEHTLLKNSLAHYIKCQESQSYGLKKKELFSGATLSSRHENRNDQALDMAESGSLDRSSKMISDYIYSGQETLNELIGQRERLKGVQRQVLDIMNYLGIGNSIMRAVERRELIDRYLVFGGMIVVLLIMFLVYYYVKR